MPSAFIPFCAYQTDMEIVGEYVDQFRFPVCSKFTPIVLDGEHCYSLDLATVIPEGKKTLQGKPGKLTLLLDYNRERSIGITNTKTKNVTNKARTLGSNQMKNQPNARIYIHTLAGYSGHGPGSYVLTSPKLMVPTDKFLMLAKEDRRCQIEATEICQRRKFLERGLHDCGCVPWEFTEVVTNKVTHEAIS